MFGLDTPMCCAADPAIPVSPLELPLSAPRPPPFMLAQAAPLWARAAAPAPGALKRKASCCEEEMGAQAAAYAHGHFHFAPVVAQPFMPPAAKRVCV